MGKISFRRLLALAIGLSCGVILGEAARKHAPTPAPEATRTKSRNLPGKGELSFYNLYSRPNDDSFQNATGNAGEPYEVARVKCGLVAEKTDTGFRLSLDWSADMSTGRHVEAGSSFRLAVSENNLAYRPKVNASRLKIRYPEGAGADSLPAEKIGSLLYTKLPMGETTKDGVYSGVSYIDWNEATGEEANYFDPAAPKDNILQTIQWSVQVKNGALVHPTLDCRRDKEPQLKLIESNFEVLDKKLAAHQPYPKQPKSAVCEKEHIGGAHEPKEEDSHRVKRLKAIGKIIKAAGCLDCHGGGNGDNQLFCDDGTPLDVKNSCGSIGHFADASFDWSRTSPNGKTRYPEEMAAAMKKLKQELGEKGLAELLDLSKNP